MPHILVTYVILLILVILLIWYPSPRWAFIVYERLVQHVWHSWWWWWWWWWLGQGWMNCKSFPKTVPSQGEIDEVQMIPILLLPHLLFLVIFILYSYKYLKFVLVFAFLNFVLVFVIRFRWFPSSPFLSSESNKGRFWIRLLSQINSPSRDHISRQYKRYILGRYSTKVIFNIIPASMRYWSTQLQMVRSAYQQFVWLLKVTAMWRQSEFVVVCAIKRSVLHWWIYDGSMINLFLTEHFFVKDAPSLLHGIDDQDQDRALEPDIRYRWFCIIISTTYCVSIQQLQDFQKLRFHKDFLKYIWNILRFPFL